MEEFMSSQKMTVFSKDSPENSRLKLMLCRKNVGKLGCLYGVILNGYFIDIGIPEDYHKAKN